MHQKRADARDLGYAERSLDGIAQQRMAEFPACHATSTASRPRIMTGNRLGHVAPDTPRDVGAR